MNWMKRWFLNNFSLKIIALVLAVILWLMVSMEITAKYKVSRKELSDIKIKLLVVNRQDLFGEMKIRLDPEAVDLLVEGPQKLLAASRLGTVTVFVDTSQLTNEGIYTLPVRVILPANVRLVSQPPSCTVELSRYQQTQ